MVKQLLVPLCQLEAMVRRPSDRWRSAELACRQQTVSLSL